MHATSSAAPWAPAPRLTKSAETELVQNRYIHLRALLLPPPLSPLSPLAFSYPPPSPMTSSQSSIISTDSGLETLVTTVDSTIVGPPCSPLYVPSADTLFRSFAAYWFNFTSRGRMRSSIEEGDPARLVGRMNDPNVTTSCIVKKMPFPMKSREFITRLVCATDTNGDVLVACVPADDVIDYGMNIRAVRGVSKSLIRFAPSGENSYLKVRPSQANRTYRYSCTVVPEHAIILNKLFECTVPLCVACKRIC